MKKIDPILARIQHFFDASTRKEMREKWDIPKNTLDTWVNRDSIPKRRLEALAEKEGLHLQWLETGESPKYKVEEVQSSDFLSPLLNEQIAARVAEAMPNYGKDERTIKIAKMFDALDDATKDEVLEEIITLIKKKL